MPSRRSLARSLEAVSDFTEPRVDLEQYLTPPEIAAHVCHTGALQGDLEGRTVVDLGTGTGMLAIGAQFAEPDRVVGVDRDPTVLAQARRNERRVLGREATEWLVADAARPPLCLDNATVLSNPPFGAQRGNRHTDRAFLEATSRIAAVSYTFHNTGSRAFVESFATDRGGTVTHAFEARFELDRRFPFHTAETKSIDVEVFRIEWDGRIEES